MSLITLIITLIAVGLVLWCINTYLPIEAGIKKIINIIVICFVVIWLLKGLGVISYLGNVHL